MASASDVVKIANQEATLAIKGRPTNIHVGMALLMNGVLCSFLGA